MFEKLTYFHIINNEIKKENIVLKKQGSTLTSEELIELFGIGNVINISNSKE